MIRVVILIAIAMCYFGISDAREYIPPQTIPQEKVYLHLDNTSYYRGEKIWFKAYVVNSIGNTATTISNTLYVELLNPGGEVIDRKTYKVTDGQTHGNFIIKHLPFYSGLYELRAYTKYMLNFGEDNYFSRAIPIFDNPKNDNDESNKIFNKRIHSKYKTLRKHPVKGNKVNLKFYPESGALIKSIPARIAFEATDAFGHPIDVKGEIITGDTIKLADFKVYHEGKGLFNYVPNNQDAHALLTYEGKKYKFKLPKPLERGFAMSVDNLSDGNNIKVKVSRSASECKDTVGVILLSQGKVIDYAYVASTFTKPLQLSFGKEQCPPGVSEIVLVDKNNDKIANRYIFKNSGDTFQISVSADNTEYAPLQPMDLSFSLKQKDGTPISTPFSLSVRDGSNEVKWNRNIMTDLLLMSEIKGYVANPEYYFESNDEMHRKDLDLLLMVQGWQKHPWNILNSLSNHNLRYKPESKGITIEGTVSYYDVKKPKRDIDVSLVMVKEGQDKGDATFFNDKFTTDSLGRFSFVADVDDDWNLVLAASKDMKRKNLTISLDNKFSPKPRDYRLQEINAEMKDQDTTVSNETYDEDLSLDEDKTVQNESKDYNRKKQKEEKTTMLNEIVVKGKNSSKAHDIYRARASAVAYYDFKESVDQMYDNGFYYCDDVNTFLCKVNRKFQPMVEDGFKYLIYNWKMPLVVVDYETTYIEDEFRYNDLPVEWIKSVYVSEDSRLINNYSDPKISPEAAFKRFGCVVFIETYPENECPAAAAYGVRKTTLHGYDSTTEFYNPDYSEYIPIEEDHRRTLYWNPMVKPDENGNVYLRIYNNSRNTRPIIDAQTVTATGLIGISQYL